MTRQDRLTTVRSTLAPLPAPDAPWQEWVRYGLAWGHHPGDRVGTRQQTQGALSAELPGRHRISLDSYREATPGARWQALFTATWPAYRSWYTAHELEARPTLTEARAALQEHMPVLVRHWERLVELAGNDALAAKMLTMWRMPAVAAGCSQVVVPGPAPLLVRNYDYDPQLFEGVVASTNYSGQRRVIGTSDLLWGLLDGMNEDGLAASLTLGGRPGFGDGFGIPIVIRYLLETCADVDAAVAALSTIPVAQAYNISLVDTAGGHATVYVAPGEPVEISDLRAATNHRLSVVEHPSISEPLRSRQRQHALFDALSDFDAGGSSSELADAFTRQPMRTEAYDRGFGTLYTAVYRPAEGSVTYQWPGRSWTRHFDDEEAHLDVELFSGVDDA
ncbi:MAG TPA: C45 family peptidase [Candidatus Limnocylindria bacterium]